MTPKQPEQAMAGVVRGLTSALAGVVRLHPTVIADIAPIIHRESGIGELVEACEPIERLLRQAGFKNLESTITIDHVDACRFLEALRNVTTPSKLTEAHS